MVCKFNPGWAFKLMLILVIGGCQVMATSQTVYAYEAIKPGAILTLLTPITFPADIAALRIQYGEVRRGQFSLDPYRPNCRLELRAQSDETRTIQPDQFVIHKVSHNIEYVMHDSIKVAGIGFNMANAVSDVSYITVLYLKSEKQPEVELLSCQHWEDPSDYSSHLTLDQIKNTLAGLMAIENP